MNSLIPGSPETVTMHVSELVELLKGLNAAHSGLNGKYPWCVNGPYSQKDARASADGLVITARDNAVKMLTQAGFDPEGRTHVIHEATHS